MNTGKLIPFAKKIAPDVMVWAGMAGIAVSTWMTAKATKKIDALLDEHDNKMLDLLESQDDITIEMTPKEVKRAKLTIYVQTGVNMVKLYWPAATAFILSAAGILGGYGIIKRRGIAVMAAYKTLEEGLREFKKRAVETLGEEKAAKLLSNAKIVEVEETDADGKKKKVKTVVKPDSSMYEFFFGPESPEWSTDPSYNLTNVMNAEKYFNHRLQGPIGHVFLNEIHDHFGIDRTPAGAVVGWVKDHGDDCIDFGLFDKDGQIKDRTQVGDGQTGFLIDPNVDGVVYDLI